MGPEYGPLVPVCGQAG